MDYDVLKRLIDNVPEKDDRVKENFSEDTKEKVLERDGHICRACGKCDGLKVHHIIPNGTADMSNLITLCFICHDYVHRQLRRKGYRYYIPKRRYA